MVHQVFALIYEHRCTSRNLVGWVERKIGIWERMKFYIIKGTILSFRAFHQKTNGSRLTVTAGQMLSS